MNRTCGHEIIWLILDGMNPIGCRYCNLRFSSPDTLQQARDEYRNFVLSIAPSHH